MKKFILILMATFTFTVFASCREEGERDEIELQEEEIEQDLEEVGNDIEAGAEEVEQEVEEEVQTDDY